jgi:arabinogalactan oligomer/maltooligosaccharide transport system substrate-binding protein
MKDLHNTGRQPGGNSIWDLRFLLSLFIPILIGTIGWGLWQAHQQNRSNQQSALDQQQAAILQTYINNMQDLLLNHSLSKSSPADEVSQVAKVQTLSTLRSLDADRNRIVLRFLQNGHLISRQNPVISLSNADLSKDDLSGADLSGINLNGAILAGADLNGANMSSSTLYDANLNGAELTGADLRDATLTSAFLGDAIMDHAVITGARLNGAILTNAQLINASLSGADLIGADLTGTDLSGADLSDANLVAEGLTKQQLGTVESCTYATLSAGLTCQHNGRITLTYWFTESPAETRIIGKLIQQFEKVYPRIHIKAVDANYFLTDPVFVNDAEQGTAPDVLRSDVGWVTQFASQGFLLNIDSYIPQASRSDYLSASLKYDYYNGQLYGLPQVTDFLALLYNKVELEKAGITSAPATMADFEKDASEAVKRKAAKYGFETDGSGYNALPFLYAFGGGMLGQNNKIMVNSNGSVNGLKFLLRLQNTDKAMPTNVNFSIGRVSSPVKDFTTGTTAMIFGGPYDVPEILTGSSFKGHPDNLGIVRIPRGPAGQTGTPVGGQSYVISARTTHPIEAYKFISFMSSKLSQVAIAKANHTLPTRKSAYQRGISGERFISEFLPVMRTAVPRPAIPQAGRLFDTFDPNIAAALDGVESPNAALNAVADAWKQLLASP